MNGLVDDERHAPFQFDAFAARSPAVLLNKTICVAVPRRGCDFAVYEFRADGIPFCINRAHNFTGHLVSLVQQDIDVIKAEVFFKAIAFQNLL